MHIAVFVLKLVVHILIYKGYSYSVGRRDYEEIENKAEEEDYRSGDKIGIEQPLEAYASRQNCYYLCICRHFGGKEDNCNKDKERTEGINEPRDKVKVVVKDNLVKRRIAIYKIIYLFTYVKDYCNTYNYKNSKDIGTYKSLYYVPV